MIEISPVAVDGQSAVGLKFLLDTIPALIILGRKGHLACGYFNMNVASRLGLAAAQVTGVRTFDDMLKADVVAVSSEATRIGITIGMKGKEALRLLMKREQPSRLPLSSKL